MKTSIVLMMVGSSQGMDVFWRSPARRDSVIFGGAAFILCHPAVEGNWPLIFLWLMGE